MFSDNDYKEQAKDLFYQVVINSYDNNDYDTIGYFIDYVALYNDVTKEIKKVYEYVIHYDESGDIPISYCLDIIDITNISTKLTNEQFGDLEKTVSQYGMIEGAWFNDSSSPFYFIIKDGYVYMSYVEDDYIFGYKLLYRTSDGLLYSDDYFNDTFILNDNNHIEWSGDCYRVEKNELPNHLQKK